MRFVRRDEIAARQRTAPQLGFQIAHARAITGKESAGHKSRGTSIPGTYNVGGRHMTKPTGEARDSSHKDR